MQGLSREMLLSIKPDRNPINNISEEIKSKLKKKVLPMGYKLRTTFLSLLLVLENKFSYGIFLLIIWFSSQGHIAFVFPKG